MKWQYLSAYCYIKGPPGDGTSAYRVLNVDSQEYPLARGLDFLGEQEWELVAAHPVSEGYGGGWNIVGDLTCLYIFKRPLALQTS